MRHLLSQSQRLGRDWSKTARLLSEGLRHRNLPLPGALGQVRCQPSQRALSLQPCLPPTELRALPWCSSWR